MGPGVGKWVPVIAGRQRQAWLIPIADERVGVQVKLWDPLRTGAIPERFCGGDSPQGGAVSSVCTSMHLYLWGMLKQVFTGRMSLHASNQPCQSTECKKYHIPRTCSPSAHLDDQPPLWPYKAPGCFWGELQWRRKQFASGGHNAGAAPAKIFLMCPPPIFSRAPHMRGHNDCYRLRDNWSVP